MRQADHAGPDAVGDLHRHLERAHPASQGLWQQLLELDEYADHGVVEPMKAIGSNPQGEGHGHPFITREQERGHRTPRAKLVPPARPSCGIDAVAELAQAIDISSQRSRGHFELSSKLRTRPKTACLEDRE